MSKLDKDFLNKNRFWMLLAVALALWDVALAKEELWLRRELLHLVQQTVQLAGKFTEVRERDWDKSPAALQTAGGAGLEYAVRRSPKFFRDRALTQQQKDANVVKSRLFRNH